jgi:hypothetical protein
LFTALGGAYPGLRLVKKQTIGTGVTSVAVTNAFSATYENYKIIVSGGVSNNAGTYLNLKLGSTATGYYASRMAFLFNGTAPSNAAIANEVIFYYAGWVDTNKQNMDMDLKMPFLTKNTIVGGNYCSSSGSGFGAFYTGILADSTSYTGFTLEVGGGATVTGGTIYVYGYGAS